MFPTLSTFAVALTWWLNCGLHVQAVNKDFRYQPTAHQGNYQVYNAYGPHSVIVPQQSHEFYQNLAVMRTKAIQDKQVQVRQMSKRFREVSAKKASTTRAPTPDEMNQSVKNKLYQNAYVLTSLGMALADEHSNVKAGRVNGGNNGGHTSMHNVDTSRVYWASPAMIKAKHFIPITEYHNNLNKQGFHVSGSSSHTNSLHAQRVPPAHTSQVSRTIERRPSHTQAATQQQPVNVHHARSNFQQYQLFPAAGKKTQYELFPSAAGNVHQHQQ
ncbi:uncharacterized protein FA14DRAFT_179976 [Meira miltonrushii]|uniref:SCP domain-containing protein n=1 Tax=Meira miltonrushii TaxID=1280837 RepID=A0A316V7A1_9BASI|nr:uncharacterized protein FA14DRAFT_179976 [Meira miltonrushii]PWN33322.1 hypothetical protein FA14DRAFT_179976 [Meira miltonrushii]